MPKVRPPRKAVQQAPVSAVPARRQEQPDPRHKTVLCKHFEQDGECKFGNKCSFAHGEAELQRKAQPKPAARDPLYKTVLCKHFEQDGECKFGNKCSFAHGETELQRKAQPKAATRDPLYKTVLCKHFEQDGECKFGNKCSFAHGETELQRVHRVHRPSKCTMGDYLAAVVQQPKPTHRRVQEIRQRREDALRPEEFPELPVAKVLSAVKPQAKMNPDVVEFVPSVQMNPDAVEFVF